jgi:hypothetical protein
VAEKNADPKNDVSFGPAFKITDYFARLEIFKVTFLGLSEWWQGYLQYLRFFFAAVLFTCFQL